MFRVNESVTGNLVFCQVCHDSHKVLKIGMVSLASYSRIRELPFHPVTVTAKDSSNVTVIVIMIQAGHLSCFLDGDAADSAKAPLIPQESLACISYFSVLQLALVRSHHQSHQCHHWTHLQTPKPLACSPLPHQSRNQKPILLHPDADR